MRLYFVECRVVCGDNSKYLVKANNKKEAFNKIWENFYIPKNKELKKSGYDPYFKKDLSVLDIEKEMFDEDGIADIW